MAFKLVKKDSSTFSTPQEMFQDNKTKTIKGILDYQSDVLTNYMKTVNNENIINKNVAFELPTGSGKTLIGILISEFQRRKNKRRCLFLCPTNQLVEQVCEQSRTKYGIDAIAFVGKQSEYRTVDKGKYTSCESIGVTTYSSFFAQGSFFSEKTDILIFDDVHSSEKYIADNWSVNITRSEHNQLFTQIIEVLANVVSESIMARFRESDPTVGDNKSWNDLLSRPDMLKICEDLRNIINVNIKDTDLIYGWKRIIENLEDCNLYMSWGSILIRPYIPPTETHEGLNKVSQRIFMSATLGRSGELERITGCRKITRLSVSNDWDKMGIGRKLFIFPDLSLDSSFHYEIISKLHQEAKRSVLIVSNDKEADTLKKEIKSRVAGIQMFTASDITKSKQEFCRSENAMVVMANRFDGVDFPDEESRMLYIYNLPKITHLQESFFVGKMAASLLYSERIKTRIMQAVGRCTRNDSDYSVVCVLGESILTDVTSEKILSTYHPEIHAEINFGVENSKDFKSCDDILENVKIFFERGEDWKLADSSIAELRNSFADQNNTREQELYKKLFQSAELELDVQYSMWKKDYQEALLKAEQIVEILNAPSLSGYKCYWQYMCGCLASEIEETKKAKQFWLDATKNNKGNVNWFSKLDGTINHNNSLSEDNLLFNVIGKIEENFIELNKNNDFEKTAKEILDGLNSDDGDDFEIAHKKLGTLLGYISEKDTMQGAPDPYWIVNEDLCIVSEDKIYKDKNKKIPLEHIRQVAQHKKWIKENVHLLRRDAKVYTVFISNSSTIEEEGRIYCEEINYINQQEFVEWANKAIDSLRQCRKTFCELGDSEWREKANDIFIDRGTTPQDFINLIKLHKLSNL